MVDIMLRSNWYIDHHAKPQDERSDSWGSL